MGKYPNSDIHDKYSDWHWGLVAINDKYKRLYVSDIDRLWIEYDFLIQEIVAVIDIKWDGSGDGMTTTEKGIKEWFEKKGAKYYIVFISQDFETFKIVDKNQNIHCKTSIEYADWLLSLRTHQYHFNSF